MPKPFLSRRLFIGTGLSFGVAAAVGAALPRSAAGPI